MSRTTGKIADAAARPVLALLLALGLCLAVFTEQARPTEPTSHLPDLVADAPDGAGLVG